MALYNGSEKFSSQIGIAQYADVTDLMKHMTIEVGDVGQGVLEFQIAVQRHNHAAIHTVLDQGFGQCTRYVSQTAGLCIRGSLAGSIQNFHKYLRWVGEGIIILRTGQVTPPASSHQRQAPGR